MSRESTATVADSADRRRAIVASAVLIAAAIGVYANSFGGQFVYDDDSFTTNPEIRRLWPVWDVLTTRPRSRPIVNLSLAINYAIGGRETSGYHLFNLAVHVCAGLALFGVVRRTLACGDMRRRFGGASTPLATGICLIWLVHPVQTESVTFIVQRAESMTGLFYLLTIYCLIRGAGASGRLWYPAAVLSCALGMGCKQVMVTAPVMALLYDRTFLSGSFARAIRARWKLYLGLAGTWLILATSASAIAGSPTAGFGMSGLGVWQFARSQFGVILHYLRICYWPSGLCFDYGWPIANEPSQILPPALAVAGLVAGTLWALWRLPALGFACAWFLVVLAPTSSVIPIADLAVEHRLYLPLAGVVALTVTGGYMILRRFPPRALGAVGAVLLGAASVALGALTVQRNDLYHDEIRFWRDAAAKSPEHPRPHYNLGNALRKAGRIGEAIPCYETAIARYQDAIRDKRTAYNRRGLSRMHNNLGVTLMRRGQAERAVDHYRNAVGIDPDYAKAHYNLANALRAAGARREAVRHYQKAIRARQASPPDPQLAHYHNNLALLFCELGRFAEAIDHFHAALTNAPDHQNAANNLAHLLATCPRKQFRNGPAALSLARRLCDRTSNRDPLHLQTLAAAQAETGQFDRAVQTARLAADLAAAAGHEDTLKRLEADLEYYVAGRRHPTVE